MKRKVLLGLVFLSLLWGGTVLGQPTYFLEAFDTDPSLCATQTPDCWYIDRYQPEKFESELFDSDNRLWLQINENQSSYNRGAQSGAFYNTQGRKYDVSLPDHSFVSIDFYLPADWASKTRRTDLWATGFDGSNAVSAYPIIGFVNYNGWEGETYEGFRYWDSNDPGLWVELSGFSFTYDTWYNLKFELQGETFYYYIDGVQVGSYVAPDTETLGNIIIQGYNFDFPDGDTYYDIYYDYLETGSSIILNGNYYATIQEAINAASPNDVINVGAGVYAENLVINKALTLNGANADVACGSRGSESVIAPSTGLPVSITADGVTLNGFEITAPGYQYAIVCGNTSNLNIKYNNIHHIGTTVTGTNVHAINYTVPNAISTSNVSITNNCIDYVSSSSLTGYSAAAIGILQSTSTGDLTNLIIESNAISNVNVNTGDWPTGKLAYGLIINVGGSGSFLTTGKVVNATIRYNEISNLSGFISTGIGLEGNTENAYVTNNKVSYLIGNKVADRSGGGYDLNALKFENNRYVSTCTVTNNSFMTNTFTHGDPDGVGYAVSNYVPTGLVYTGGTTGAATVTCNWLGTANYSEIQDNEDLDGRVLTKVNCSLVYIPYLTDGTDTDPALGFQPVAGSCIEGYPVHNVTADTWHATIQDAIDLAAEYDVIEAQSGTYTEQLHITTNNLTLIGESKSNTFIQSPATLTLFFTSSADNYPVVFVEGVTTFSISGFTIDGDGKGNDNVRFVGIGVYNAGIDLQNVDITGVRNTPFSGAQHGVSIFTYSNAGGPYDVTCKNVLVEDYQKTAIVYYGNFTLDIDNVTTIGNGATDVTAQNGFQFGPDVTGSVKNCDVQDVQWTGATWTSSGMIVDGDITIQNTTFTGCQTSLYVTDASPILDHLTITAPIVVVDDAYGIIAWSTAAARSENGMPEASPFEAGYGGGSRSSDMTLEMEHCKLTGNMDPGSVGVYLFSENTLTADIQKCKFEDWEYAIYAEGYAGGVVNATVNKCNLGNNTYGFVNVPSAMRADADATDNWWGDETGPYDPVGNPSGQGSEVSDFVNYADWITDPVDISISNPECGVLEVTCVPSMPLDGQVTNILFAVSWNWVAYPDAFFSTQSDYNVSLQYYYNDGTVGYAVFGTDLTAIDWDAGVGDVILTIVLNNNKPEGTVSDFFIADDAWTAANNADYYFEFWGYDLTGFITGFAENVYLGPCDLQLHLNVMLQGPYNTSDDVMNIDLNLESLIPSGQPFNVAPWSYPGTESIATVPADMVDWVLVELRETAAGAPFARQAALLYKDGSVKSADGSGDDIYFTGEFMPNLDFYVVVYARNHMPVMSADVINIPNANDRYDFSDMATYPSYGGATAQVLLESGVHGLVAGDINGDGDLIYSGTDNDRALILQRIIIETTYPYINGVTQGYFLEDLTMNSWVKYSGALNDQRLIILNLIELEGVYDLNAVYESLVPGWGAKAAHYNPGNGPIDIALVDNTNTLDVVLVAKENLGETWSDNIQFTLSWDENNVMMNQLVYNYTSDFLLEPQGEVRTDNGTSYMTFAVVDWLALPAPFNTGDQVTVLSLQKGSYIGQASKATIAQDGYALMHNGLYYVSLLGQDKTGQVLDGYTGIEDPATASSSLSLYPNPVVNGQVTLSMMPALDELITITISDVSARTVYQETLQVYNGTPLVKTINLKGLESGTYLVRMQGTDSDKTGKIIVR